MGHICIWLVVRQNEPEGPQVSLPLPQQSSPATQHPSKSIQAAPFTEINDTLVDAADSQQHDETPGAPPPKPQPGMNGALHSAAATPRSPSDSASSEQKSARTPPPVDAFRGSLMVLTLCVCMAVLV